jgi:branched-chain amino acid transport system permease protein
VNDVILYAILGLGTGAAYILLGLGTVVIYKGSGVINFAQGAVGMVAAAVTAELRSSGVPTAIAIIVSLALAIALGAIIYLLVMRPLRHAPALARNVATLGVLIFLLAAVIAMAPSIDSLNVQSVVPSRKITVIGVTFGEDKLYMLAIACVIALVLAFVFRRTRLGLATRAVSENELGASLLGFSPTVIGCFNWIVGSLLAGMAGILIAPSAGIDPTGLTFLVVPALAAALIGGFSSFGWTCVGAIVLGIVQSEMEVVAPSLEGANELVPLVLMIIVMVFRNRAIPSRDVLVQGRPPQALAGRFRIWYLIAPVVLVALVVFAAPSIQSQFVFAMQTSMCLGIVFLSQTLVTGYAGQISLAQISFAGLGVLLSARLGTTFGIPFPLPVILAGVIAFPIGALFGLPALRVRGVTLAVLTLAMTAAAYTAIFGEPVLTGGPGQSYNPTPSLFGINLNAVVYPQRYLIVTFVFLALATVAIWLIRRSALGRKMLAVRENERAAAATGVSVTRTKLLAFSIASTFAAVGGALIAYQSAVTTYQAFQPANSISILATSYIFGVGSPLAAIIAGFFASGGLVQTLLSSAFSTSVTLWIPMVLALLLILTVVTNPDGAVPYFRTIVLNAFARRSKTGEGDPGTGEKDPSEPGKVPQQAG